MGQVKGSDCTSQEEARYLELTKAAEETKHAVTEHVLQAGLPNLTSQGWQS